MDDFMSIDPKHLTSMTGGQEHKVIPSICQQCGYNLTGAVSDRCPECGHNIIPKQQKEIENQLLQNIEELKNANKNAQTGLYISFVGAGALLVSLLLSGSCVSIALKGIAFVAGFTSIFLGLGVFRARRIPTAIQEHLSFSPLTQVATPAILLGIVNILVAILSI